MELSDKDIRRERFERRKQKSSKRSGNRKKKESKIDYSLDVLTNGEECLNWFNGE